MNLFYCVACIKRLCYYKYSIVCRFSKRFIYILYNYLFVSYESMCSLTNHSEPLLDGLFKRSSYGHYFANTFHTTTNLTAYTMKFSKIPSRDFTYYIVESRFKKGRSGFSYRVFKVEQTISESQFCCYKGKWVTCSLDRKS